MCAGAWVCVWWWDERCDGLKNTCKLFRLSFSTGRSSRICQVFRLDPPAGQPSRKKLSFFDCVRQPGSSRKGRFRRDKFDRVINSLRTGHQHNFGKLKSPSIKVYVTVYQGTLYVFLTFLAFCCISYCCCEPMDMFILSIVNRCPCLLFRAISRSGCHDPELHFQGNKWHPHAMHYSTFAPD